MFAPLSYRFDKGSSVHQETQQYLKDHDLMEELSELYWMYYSIGSVIPHTMQSMWSGHFFPWKESWEEFQISFNLCSMGFYKQAMSSLRSAFELGLLSVYWNINDDGHEVIKDWLNANKDTPRLIEIWRKLESNRNIQSFQRKFDLHGRMMHLNELHNYVHSKGARYSNSMGLPLKPNFQSFHEKAIHEWMGYLRETIIILAILHLLKYPVGIVKMDYSKKFGIDIPFFGGLEEFEIERIARIVGESEFSELNAIAESDDNVKGIIEWIQSLPDMTEVDVEEQIRKFEKEAISQHGLELWLENQERLSDSHTSDPNYQERKIYLINWAKENGYENLNQVLRKKFPDMEKSKILSIVESLRNPKE